MNERIRQLAEQAMDTVEIVNPDTGITHHREFFDKEKFAELIVWECAQVADTERPSSLGCGYITKTTGMRIKEHFGVD